MQHKNFTNAYTETIQFLIETVVNHKYKVDVSIVGQYLKSPRALIK